VEEWVPRTVGASSEDTVEDTFEVSVLCARKTLNAVVVREGVESSVEVSMGEPLLVNVECRCWAACPGAIPSE